MPLLLWYIVSLAGINVHRCTHTGEMFVTLLCEGISCEAVHGGLPHEHTACGCVACHHEHSSEDSEGCCHNDSHSLTLTGEGQVDNTRHHVAPFSFSPAIVYGDLESKAAFSVLDRGFRPLLLGFHHKDLLSSFCVLRV